MKIRNGFVSNSSSSSFLIPEENYENVFELAKVMLKHVEHKPQLNKILQLLKETKKDPNTPVMFYSCNYDTYISKHGDHYFVNTCNNEDWDIGYSIDAEYNKVVEELYPEFVGQYGGIDWDKVDEKTTYWDLEYNHMFKTSNEWKTCERKGQDGKKLCGYSSMVIIYGELQCPNCYHLPNGKPSKYFQFKNRDKKLERINNK